MIKIFVGRRIHRTPPFNMGEKQIGGKNISTEYFGNLSALRLWNICGGKGQSE